MKGQSGKLVVVAIVILLLGTQSLLAQEFVGKRLKKSKILKIEQKLHSNQIKMDDTVTASRQIYPFEYAYDLSNPYHFQRSESEFSPLPQVKYFFNEKNDKLCFVEYSWQIENIIDPQNTDDYFKQLENESSRLEEYKAFYEKLAAQLEAQYGTPLKDHGYIVIDELGTPVHQRVLKFMNDDNYAHLHLRFATEGAHPGLHRIILRIYWE
ncbi:MAG: hypothetical protein JEZ03_09160 [Bacteroidales bacterium]|nr:hypothetical protein [Bacteroidales bacterium]